jgi:hypothetical protein
MKKAEIWRSSDIECECPYCMAIQIIGSIGDEVETYDCEECGKTFEIGELNE